MFIRTLRKIRLATRRFLRSISPSIDTRYLGVSNVVARSLPFLARRFSPVSYASSITFAALIQAISECDNIAEVAHQISRKDGLRQGHICVCENRGLYKELFILRLDREQQNLIIFHPVTGSRLLSCAYWGHTNRSLIEWLKIRAGYVAEGKKFDPENGWHH